MSLRPPTEFAIPPEAFDVNSPKEREVVFFELKSVKPKGYIYFPRETVGYKFEFSAAGLTVNDGIIAKLEDTSTNGKRMADYLEKYPKQEFMVVLTLLQAKIYFLVSNHTYILGSNPKSFMLGLPEHFKKIHRRKYVRIPFADAFPATLRFQLNDGTVVTRKLKDLSREGMKVKIEDGDIPSLVKGEKLKGAVLRIIDREMPIGLQIMNVYPGPFMGLKMLAMSGEDENWIKEIIKLLMQRILKLSDEEIAVQQRAEED